jgi:hypothetical protein
LLFLFIKLLLFITQMRRGREGGGGGRRGREEGKERV